MKVLLASIIITLASPSAFAGDTEISNCTVGVAGAAVLASPVIIVSIARNPKSGSVITGGIAGLGCVGGQMLSDAQAKEFPDQEQLQENLPGNNE